MKQRLVHLAWIIAVGLLYYATGRFGLSLAAIVHPSASAIWPATGLAIASAVLLGPSIWPAIFIAAFCVNFHTGASPFAALLIATGNTLEAAVASVLMRRFTGGRFTFDRSGDVFRFVFFVAVPCCIISATFGLVALLEDARAGIERAPGVWLTWWLGDMVGAIVVTPLILVWTTAGFRLRRRRRIVEAALLLVAATAIALFIYGNPILESAARRPVGFFSLPMFIWAAYRFHQRGAMAVALVYSVVGVVGTLRGLGPYANLSTNAGLLLMSAYIAVVTVTALVLAASLSERSRAEEALRKAEARGRAILDSAVDGVITIDERGTIEQVNPAVERLFGYRPDETIGRNIRMLMPNPFAGEHDGYLANYLRTGQRKIIGLSREVPGRRKDGSIFPFDLSVSELRLGRSRFFTGIIHDISEHKRARQEREEILNRERAARDEAERASRAKDQFIAVLSHELRTPLTPVLLTVAALEEDRSLPVDLREQLSVVRRNVELEARLIDDLLDLTRVARGKLQLRLAPHDLHDIIAGAVRICATDDRVPIQTSFEATRFHVNADPGRMQQVFWNLLNNAQKFTAPSGRVTVTTSDAADGAIVVSVADTGIGIEPQLLPRLFNAFEQGEAGQNVSRSGLGLGLAISKALVVAHSGTIHASSDGPGCGATFTVTLPTVAAVARELVPGANGEPATLPRRILLVEDDRTTLAVLSRLLESRRHHVTTADSVSSALQAAAASAFDLVISDLGLPDGSGDELMRELRSRFGLRGIALSGYGMESDVRRSLDAGFDEHLTKPIDLGALESAMGRVLT